jgi:hypothetical protein
MQFSKLNSELLAASIGGAQLTPSRVKASVRRAEPEKISQKEGLSKALTSLTSLIHESGHGTCAGTEFVSFIAMFS